MYFSHTFSEDTENFEFSKSFFYCLKSSVDSIHAKKLREKKVPDAAIINELLFNICLSERQESTCFIEIGFSTTQYLML